MQITSTIYRQERYESIFERKTVGRGTYVFHGVYVCVDDSDVRGLHGQRTEEEKTRKSGKCCGDTDGAVTDGGNRRADGGCEGYDGSCEKDYNLANAKKLRVFFDMAGFDTVMTRDTDDDTDGDGSGFSKKKDIRNRVEIAESAADSILLSIHANLSTAERDKGFTAFYGVKREDSQLFAEKITEACADTDLCTRIRDVKKAPSTVYIQQNVDRVSVLIECGFLSNHEDLALLKSDEYRQKLMFAVFRGVVTAQEERG